MVGAGLSQGQSTRAPGLSQKGDAGGASEAYLSLVLRHLDVWKSDNGEKYEKLNDGGIGEGGERIRGQEVGCFMDGFFSLRFESVGWRLVGVYLFPFVHHVAVALSLGTKKRESSPACALCVGTLQRD